MSTHQTHEKRHLLRFVSLPRSVGTVPVSWLLLASKFPGEQRKQTFKKVRREVTYSSVRDNLKTLTHLWQVAKLGRDLASNLVIGDI